MPYATLQDVLDAAPKLVITSTTKPSTQDVESIVAMVDAELDGFLRGLGYVTPVTGTKSKQVLKDIAVQGILARTLKAMFYGVRDPEEVGANDAWREYRRRLADLANPNHPLTLEDAVVSDQAPKETTEVVSDFVLESDQTENFRPTRDQVF